MIAPPPPYEILSIAPIRHGWRPPPQPNLKKASENWSSLTFFYLTACIGGLLALAFYSYSYRVSNNQFSAYLVDAILFASGYLLALWAGNRVCSSVPKRHRHEDPEAIEGGFFIIIAIVFFSMVPLHVPINAFLFLAAILGVAVRTLTLISFFCSLSPPSPFAKRGWFSELASRTYLKHARSKAGGAAVVACLLCMASFVHSAGSFFHGMCGFDLNSGFFSLFLVAVSALLPATIILNMTLESLRRQAAYPWIPRRIPPTLPVDDPGDFIQAWRDRHLLMRFAAEGRRSTNANCFELNNDI